MTKVFTGLTSDERDEANPFLRKLMESLLKPMDWEDFRRSYQGVVDMVATQGSYSLHGMLIQSPAGVYSPHETSSTRYVCGHFEALGLLNARPGQTALEIGSGAGGIAILLAKNGWTVTAVDIDHVAVSSTADNARLNNVKLTAKHSDLFDNVDGQFDVIVFNQPLWHKPTEIDLNERTLSSHGSELYKRFMDEAKRFLKPGGQVIVSYANFSDPDVLAREGWALDVKAFDYEGARNTVRAILSARAL